jgi:fumarylpyruvate hydrolase
VTQYLFAPPAIVSIPIFGKAEAFPVRRIFCVGRNYEAHAKEMGMQIDREVPFFFTKSSCHYVPSGSEVSYPQGTSNYHYEMEMVVAIGKEGSQITESDAPRLTD